MNMNNHGGRRKGAGRPVEGDPRVAVPFRMRRSLVEKMKRLGRDRVENMVKRAKELED
jgi:hypothetical protein